MTIRELYEAVGEDYQSVLERFDDAEIIEAFVLRFTDDPSYAQLLRHLQQDDLTGAFRAAHTLKSVSKALGFDRLGHCAGMLCEELRESTPPSEALLQQTKAAYHCISTAINDYKSQQ